MQKTISSSFRSAARNRESGGNVTFSLLWVVLASRHFCAALAHELRPSAAGMQAKNRTLLRYVRSYEGQKARDLRPPRRLPAPPPQRPRVRAGIQRYRYVRNITGRRRNPPADRGDTGTAQERRASSACMPYLFASCCVFFCDDAMMSAGFCSHENHIPIETKEFHLNTLCRTYFKRNLYVGTTIIIKH